MRALLKAPVVSDDPPTRSTFVSSLNFFPVITVGNTAAKLFCLITDVGAFASISVSAAVTTPSASTNRTKPTFSSPAGVTYDCSDLIIVSPGAGLLILVLPEAVSEGGAEAAGEVAGTIASSVSVAGAAGWQAARETAQTIVRRNKKAVGRGIVGLSILLTVRHNATMKLWKSPIRILLLYLSFLSVWATYNWDGLDITNWVSQLTHFGLIVVPGLLIYNILLKGNFVKPTRWEHRAITALILFLLFDPLFPWWVFLAAGLITEVVQRFVRLPTGPIVNPAALGALALGLIGQFPTWWGVNFGPRFEFIPGNMSLVMLLTTIVAGYVAWKYKKLPIVAFATLSFSVAYAIIFQANPVPILVDGTFAFFLLVMAVEPKTSPAIQRQQVTYGVVLGILLGLFLRAAYTGAWIEPYTTALVLSNILFNGYKNKMFLQNRLKKPVPVTPPVTAQPASA